MNKISTLWAAGTIALWTGLAASHAFAAGPNQAQADQLVNRDSWAQSETTQAGNEITVAAPDGRGIRMVTIAQDPAYATSSTVAQPVAIVHSGRGMYVAAPEIPATINFALGNGSNLQASN